MDPLFRLSHLLVVAPLALAGLASRVAAPLASAPLAAAPDSALRGWWASPPPKGLLQLDTVEKHGGRASAHFVATPQVGPQPPSGPQGPRVNPLYVTYTVNARPYRERRIRMSLWVRTRLPDKAAPNMPVSKTNVFMRIQNEDETIVLHDGNVSPIFGSTEWTRKFVVLEVPPDAFSIGLGVAVTGPGEVWIDDVLLEDQGQAMGSWQKMPMMPPGMRAQLTPDQLARGKEQFAGSIERSTRFPGEIVNGDFEPR